MAFKSNYMYRHVTELVWVHLKCMFRSPKLHRSLRSLAVGGWSFNKVNTTLSSCPVRGRWRVHVATSVHLSRNRSTCCQKLATSIATLHTNCSQHTNTQNYTHTYTPEEKVMCWHAATFICVCVYVCVFNVVLAHIPYIEILWVWHVSFWNV